MGENTEKFNFLQGSCKQMLKVCMCLYRWLRRMSGSSCPMGTTPQQSLGPTPTSLRRIGSCCPNLMELRPPSGPPNLEPTSDTSANRCWNLWRCRKNNRYAHVCQPPAALGWIWVCLLEFVFHFVLLLPLFQKQIWYFFIWIKVNYDVLMKTFSVPFFDIYLNSVFGYKSYNEFKSGIFA